MKEIDNSKCYESTLARTVFGTNSMDGLWPIERSCVAMVGEDRRGAVLDIGVGGGRTTSELSHLFASYLGVDYSSAMIDEAKVRNPDCNLQVMDARQLDLEESFDCVVFSYNGIDYVTYDDRKETLRRIHRALKAGGFLIYSTHNAEFERRALWMSKFWAPEIAFGRGLARITYNRLRLFFRQEADPHGRFFVVNDPGMAFGLLTVYVDLREEIEFLKEIGFSVERTVGSTATKEGYSNADAWVYCVAQKA